MINSRKKNQGWLLLKTSSLTDFDNVFVDLPLIISGYRRTFTTVDMPFSITTTLLKMSIFSSTINGLCRQSDSISATHYMCDFR